MRIETDDGAVVCSLEDKNKEFLSACAGLFDGFIHGKLKLEWLEKGEENPTEALSINVYRLETLLKNAQKYGIFVEQTVVDRFADLKKQLNDYPKYAAFDNFVSIQTKWQKLCKRGCGLCSYLRRCGNDCFCTASGDLLEEKNCPTVINGLYHLVNFVAFPSENCPFNMQKQEV